MTRWSGGSREQSRCLYSMRDKDKRDGEPYRLDEQSLVRYLYTVFQAPAKPSHKARGGVNTLHPDGCLLLQELARLTPASEL